MKGKIGIIIEGAKIIVDKEKLQPDKIGQLQGKDIKLISGEDRDKGVISGMKWFAGGVDSENIAKSIRKLFSGFASDIQMKYVFKAIEAVSLEKRNEEIIACVSDMFKRVQSENIGRSIVNIVKKRSYNEAENFIRRTKYLLCRDDWNDCIVKIDKSVDKISGDKRDDFVEKIFLILSGVKNRLVGEKIINKIDDMSPEDRVEVLKIANNILAGIDDESVIQLIIDAVNDIPPGERENLEGLKELVNEVDIKQLSVIIEFIMLIPPQERAEMIDELNDNHSLKENPYKLMNDFQLQKAVYDYLSDLLDILSADKKRGFDFSYVITGKSSALFLSKKRSLFQKAAEIKALFCPFKKETIELAKELLEGMPSGGGLLDDAGNLILKIPAVDREETVGLVKTLSKSLESVEQIKDLLKGVVKIPDDERVEILRMSTTLAKGASGLKEIETIIDRIRRLPKGEREEIVRLIGPLFSGVEDAEHVDLIVDEFIKIPREERVGFIKDLEPFLKRCRSTRSILFIIGGKMADLSIESRRDALKRSETVLEGIDDDVIISNVINMIGKTSFDERGNIEKIRDLLGVADSHQLDAIFRFIQGVPPEERGRAIDKLKFRKDLREYPYKLLREDNELRKNVHRYLSYLLDKPLGKAYALWLIISPRYLSVYEDHPLFKKIERSGERRTGERSTGGDEEQINALLKECGRADSVRRLIKTIPVRDRAEVVELTRHLLEGVYSSYLLDSIIKTICNIPSEERAEAVRLTRDITGSTNNIDDIYVALQVVLEIPANERAEIIRLVKVVLKGSVNREDIKSIIEEIRQTPAEKREVIAGLTAAISEGVQEMTGMGDLIRAIREVPEKAVADLMRDIKPFAKRCRRPYTIAQIVNSIKESSPKDRQDALQRAEDILEGVRDEAHIPVIIGAIDKMFPGERGNLEKMKGLVNILNIGQLLSVCGLMLALPPSEREGVIAKIISRKSLRDNPYNLFREDAHIKEASHQYLSGLLGKLSADRRRAFELSYDVVNSPQKIALYRDNPLYRELAKLKIESSPFEFMRKKKLPEKIEPVEVFLSDNVDDQTKKAVRTMLGKIPERERAEIIELAKDLLEGVYLGNDLGRIMAMIIAIPANERAEIVKLTRDLSGSATNIYSIIYIMKVVKDIPPNERAEIAKLLKTFPRRGGFGAGTEEIIEAVRAIPVEKRAGIIKEVKSVLKGGETASDISKIINMAGTLSPKDRRDVLKRTKDILEEVDNEHITPVVVMEIIKEIPFAERDSIEKIKDLLGVAGAGQITTIGHFMAKVPPRERGRAVILLASEKNLRKNPYRLLREDAQIKAAVHQYLLELLDGESVDKKRVSNLANMIVDQPDLFCVYRDHPLFQKAVQVKRAV